MVANGTSSTTGITGNSLMDLGTESIKISREAELAWNVLVQAGFPYSAHQEKTLHIDSPESQIWSEEEQLTINLKPCVFDEKCDDKKSPNLDINRGIESSDSANTVTNSKDALTGHFLSQTVELFQGSESSRLNEMDTCISNLTEGSLCYTEV